jgi:prepilin-type N-terminal cleavage/methylation domain-containing protein
MQQGPAAQSNRGGFTLIEVVVSLILLTVGLFAVAQLFVATSMASHGSLHRTVAEIQAVDMGERMWMDLGDPLTGVDDWQAVHDGSLPGWEGTVELVDAGSPEVYRIRVAWTERRVTGNAPPFFDHFVRLPRVE